MLIEADDRYNDMSCCSMTTSINSAGSDKESAENFARWAWLIDNWSKMTFKEKIALFNPKLHYIDIRNKFKPEFDDKYEEEIAKFVYESCRTIADIKYEQDGRGVPAIILVGNPIDINSIPDTKIRAEVNQWGRKFGLVKYDTICPCGSDCEWCSK